jgi:hypothetical protein
MLSHLVRTWTVFFLPSAYIISFIPSS